MYKRLVDLIGSEQCLSESQVRKFYERAGKYDNVFVINMATRHERLESATATLKKVGLKFSRFVAISGAELNKKDAFYTNKFPLLRPGELGCLLSHLAIAALASKHENQDSYTIIFEDDVITSSGQEAFNSVLDEISKIDRREGIDIIYFGKCLESCGNMVQIKDNIYRAVAPSCCHAYAIKNSFARKIIKDLDNCSNSAIDCEYFNRGVDSIYGDMIIYGWANGIVLHPAIFYQDVLSGGSDLRSEYMINYQECNDTNPHKEKECDPGDQGWWKINRQRRMIILLIVVIVVLVIAFMLYWKKDFVYRNMIMKNPNRTFIWLIVLFAAILIPLLIIFIKCSVKTVTDEVHRRIKCNERREFDPAPNGSLITLTMACKSHEFKVNPSLMASKTYDVFNPNGIWRDDKYILTMRCFNGKVSYPLIQTFNRDLDMIIDGKKLSIYDPKPIVMRNYIGFEDMRIFEYAGELYLIGVNLDRNVKDLPSMCLVKLDKNYNSVDCWHLRYEPLMDFPNKNWSPLVLPNGELGFVVDIDPLLIVCRQKNGQYLENCEVAYSGTKKTSINKLRNSTITIQWKDIPSSFKKQLESHFKLNTGHGKYRYLLMGHTKYVESDYKSDGYLVLYQHHFAVIELDPANTNNNMVYISKPFYVEQDTRPHIEYISGFAFRGSHEMIIMYGLRDVETKYLVLDQKHFSNYL